MAFTMLDGTSFWIKNAKKKHLLAFKTLNGNALMYQNASVHAKCPEYIYIYIYIYKSNKKK